MKPPIGMNWTDDLPGGKPTDRLQQQRVEVFSEHVYLISFSKKYTSIYIHSIEYMIICTLCMYSSSNSRESTQKYGWWNIRESKFQGKQTNGNDREERERKGDTASGLAYGAQREYLFFF